MSNDKATTIQLITDVPVNSDTEFQALYLIQDAMNRIDNDPNINENDKPRMKKRIMNYSYNRFVIT